MIHSLPTTEENFARAWKSLKDYYENKRLLRSCYANFVSLPKMKDKSAVKLKKIFHSVVSTAGCLEGIGRLINSNENLFVLHLTIRRNRHRTTRYLNSLNDACTF